MPQFKPIGQLKVTAKLQPHPKDIVTAYFDDQNSLAQSEIDTDGVISADILPKVGGVRIRIPAPVTILKKSQKCFLLTKLRATSWILGLWHRPPPKLQTNPLRTQLKSIQLQNEIHDR
jgi:hypothetical protein